MKLSLRLFARPALMLVGGLLKKLDKNKTGIEDKVGEKLQELARDPNLDGLLDGLEDDDDGD